MKRGELTVVFFILIVSLAAFSSASQCELTAQLLNQDPYPAVPNDYVKVVFQINGTNNPECGTIFAEVIPQYPFYLDSNDTTKTMLSGNFIQGYPSYYLAGYKIRVDSNAIDGANPIKLMYGTLSAPGKYGVSYTKDFDVEIEDSRTDFEVMIQDYTVATSSVTFAIVNIGKRDVEALTLEIPKQTNIGVKGSNKVIIGSLNSNDDTTVSMSAIPSTGDIVVNLYYNDQIGVRRSIEKTITFTNGFLENGKNVVKPVSTYVYLFWGLIILIIIYNVYGYFKRKSKMREKLFMRNLK